MNDSTTYTPATVSNSFSPKRCLNYLRLYYAGNRRTALLMFLAVIGVLTLAFVSQNMVYADGANDAEIMQVNGVKKAMVAVFFLIFSALSASMMFNRLSTKKERLSFLTLPALASEKYWARMFVHIPVFVVMFFAAVFISDLLRWAVFSALPGAFALPIAGVDLYILPGIDRNEGLLYIIVKSLNYFSLVSIFALGSILFPRLPFIKTCAVNLILWTIFLALIATSIFTFFGDVAIEPRFGKEWGNREAELYILCISGAIQVGLTLFMFTLTYLRLKESEVINRW